MKEPGRKKEKVKLNRKQTSKKGRTITIVGIVGGLVAVGGFTYLFLTRRKNQTSAERLLMEPSEESNTIYLDQKTSSAVSTTTNSGFPLKRGSRGVLVNMLQKALSKTDPSIMIDGQFGPQTASALIKAGFAEKVDEATFSKITNSTVKIVFDPAAIGKKLYDAARSTNSVAVLTSLNEMKSVQDYSSVNEFYKKHGFISRTIATDLLDYAFKNNDDAKEQIKSEFLRIGLKVSSSGTWSLQGIALHNDLITLRDTIVKDGANNRIPVRGNTILGEEIKIENGLSWFRSVDNNILSVPARDVKSINTSQHESRVIKNVSG